MEYIKKPANPPEQVTDAGVFWPKPDDPLAELSGGSRHHLVWVDIRR